MLKILPPRLQQYMNQELSDVQARFRKGRGTREQTDNNHWIIEKAREFQKKKKKKRLTSALLTLLKLLTVWITTTCGKLRDGNTRPPYLLPEKPVFRSRNNS